MKVLYSILVVVATTMILPLLMFSSADDEAVYAQQEENQTDFIDIQERMNLTLGKSIYTEIFTVPKSQDDNLTSSVYSFSGNGTLNGMKVSTTGMVLQERMVLVPLLTEEHFLLLKMVGQVILLEQ